MASAAEYSYLLTDIKAPTDWMLEDISIAELKRVLFLAIALKEHLVMEGKITPDDFIVVDFQDVRTKLLTDEQGYWFKKLNFIDDDEDEDDVVSIFLTVFLLTF